MKVSNIILHVVREKETFTETTQKEIDYNGKRKILPYDENDGS